VEREDDVMSEAKNRAFSSRVVRSKTAAQYIAVSQWKLRELVRRGVIPVICDEPGGAWRFDVDDLDAYIARTKRVL